MVFDDSKVVEASAEQSDTLAKIEMHVKASVYMASCIDMSLL
jgi:hypothetical protein